MIFRLIFIYSYSRLDYELHAIIRLSRHISATNISRHFSFRAKNEPFMDAEHAGPRMKKQISAREKRHIAGHSQVR